MGDVEESLGLRLSRLCAVRSGRLPGLRFHDYGARAAILIDLVLRRRISRTSNGEWIVSTTPTGIVVFDAMLDYLDRYPGTTTHRILAKAPGRLTSFRQTPESNRWPFRKPRFGRGEMETEHKRVGQAVSGNIDSAQTASLAMLADVLRLVVLSQPGSVLSECGEAAWMVEECVAELLLVRYRFEFSAAAGSSGGS